MVGLTETRYGFVWRGLAVERQAEINGTLVLRVGSGDFTGIDIVISPKQKVFRVQPIGKKPPKVVVTGQGESNGTS